MNIQLIPEEIQQLGTNLMKYQDELTTKITSFYKVVAAVEKDWQSEEISVYLNVMRKDYQLMLDSVTNLVNEYTTYIKNIPNAYLELDEYYFKTTIDI